MSSLPGVSRPAAAPLPPEKEQNNDVEMCSSSSQRFMSTTNKAAAELNYYEVMGISRHATSDDIKKAYIERAKVSHPDVRKETDEDAIAFQVLKEAYDVLSDDSKRARYDSKLKAAYSTGQAPKSLSERDRESRSIRESAQSMRKEKAEANAAMPMWYVGQTAEKPTNHQVYYYKQTVAAERAFDISHSRSMRSHKIVPMSRGRSLLWVASPLFVVGVWVYNYANWGSGKEKDPYAKFRKKRERN